MKQKSLETSEIYLHILIPNWNLQCEVNELSELCLL